ncbi:3'-5' exoribonuclease 1-like [Fagus crenata]
MLRCYSLYPNKKKKKSTQFLSIFTLIWWFQVDKGVLLSEALLLHDKWLKGKGIIRTNFAVVTWSNWDCQVMLESECRLKRIRKPLYFNSLLYNEEERISFGAVKCNLKEAVQLAGLVWEGRAHCGLDDAKNTAHLLAHIMHRGFRYSITDSLMCQPVECSFPMQRFLDRQSVYAQQSFRIKHPSLPFIQCHPFQVDSSKELGVFCYCGAKSSKQMV